VSLSGSILTLRLTQEQGTVDSNPQGYVSRGALVFTQKKYGYGTYEWRMRMTSTAADPGSVGAPVSGSVSAGFVYVNNSETEIDFEYGGHVLAPNDPDDVWADNLLYLVNWHNTDPSTGPFGSQMTFSTVEVIALNSMFHTFTFVWEPGQITFSVNGQVKAVHTTDVPEAPAHFMINHWGTNNPNWGGEATIGVERYFYVDWVKYTPFK
jgi:endo-1,3-1,4-beta-glycanase ExoK